MDTTQLFEFATQCENDGVISHNELHKAIGEKDFIELEGEDAHELTCLNSLKDLEDETIPDTFDREIFYNSFEEIWLVKYWDADGNTFKSSAGTECRARLAALLRLIADGMGVTSEAA